MLAIIAGLALALPLAACGNKAVATTSGGKITESEYYSSMKQTSNGKQVLQQMILDKVLEKQYGSKVSTSEVNSEYNAYKKEYGSSFSTVLSEEGLTAKSFKQQIRSNLLLKAAVRNYSTFSSSALKKQWKKYEPKVQTAEILVGSKETAQSIIDTLNEKASINARQQRYETMLEQVNVRRSEVCQKLLKYLRLHRIRLLVSHFQQVLR